jgi:hypothetical protein
MRNVYELEVRAVCPIHSDLIDVYQVRIESASLIKVETILEHFKQYEGKQIFQETMAQESAVALGVTVEITGMHAGVKVVSVAP